VFISRIQQRYLIRSDVRQRDKCVSAVLLQYGKRVLQCLNNILKIQGQLVFVTVRDVVFQTLGKETMDPMNASALMFFNCSQRVCENLAYKTTPISIKWNL